MRSVSVSVDTSSLNYLRYFLESFSAHSSRYSTRASRRVSDFNTVAFITKVQSHPWVETYRKILTVESVNSSASLNGLPTIGRFESIPARGESSRYRSFDNFVKNVVPVISRVSPSIWAKARRGPPRNCQSHDTSLPVQGGLLTGIESTETCYQCPCRTAGVEWIRLMTGGVS